MLLVTVLLTIPVFADMGPKDQLAVRVENAPDELYYLDLVQEGNSALPEEIQDSLAWNYTKEEFAALDQDILAAMTAAVPEGWSACIAQRATGVPMWGKLTGEDGIHEFGYVGVPGTCRILIATKSGEVFLSEPFTRRVLQSSVTVDWAAKTVEAPPVSLGYAAQFLATFLPTLVMEGAVLLAFRLWSKRNGWVFLLTNLATQGGLTLWMSVRTVHSGVFITLGDWLWECFYSFSRGDVPERLENILGCLTYLPPRLLQAELVVFLAEMGLYCRFFRGCSKKRAALYALTANLCSLLLGWYLAEPVWKFVVAAIL